MTPIALALRAIDKRFGTTQALSQATLDVRRGTLHAVLGENGAGKTTLMRIAFGLLRPDAGEILVDGRPVQLRSGADAMAAGLGMVHQHFSLVPAMTAGENVALGGHGRFDAREWGARLRDLSQRAGLPVDPDARIDTLGVGAQQRVEILKALARDARTLILDEPTAVLTPTEADELFAWLRRFVTDGGTVVLITHKLNEALALADDVTVLRRGRVVLTAPAADTTVDALVHALTGEEGNVPVVARAARRAPGEVVAQLAGASATDGRGVLRVRSADVTICRGEVVGVAGVEGSGVHEVLRLLAGRLAPAGGTATLPARIGFVPEDRLRDAVIEEFSLTENFALRDAATRRGGMPWAALRERTAVTMRVRDVRADSPAAPAGSLSGGNQQKFVLGRELEGEPTLVVAENPVRGLDVRASHDVLQALGGVADAGGAVVLYSSDIDEVLPLADRMLVVFAGTVREVPVARDAVAHALVGAA